MLDLAQRGMLHYTQAPRLHVGMLFVHKKDGRLRMIIDARASNLMFSTAIQIFIFNHDINLESLTD